MFVSTWLLGCGVLADGSLLDPLPASAPEEVRPPAADAPDEPNLEDFVPFWPEESPREDPSDDGQEPAPPASCDEAWEGCVGAGQDWFACESQYQECLGEERPSETHCVRLMETCWSVELPEEECEAYYLQWMEWWSPEPEQETEEEPDGDEELCNSLWEECIASGEDEAWCEERRAACLQG
jgi:hypothetical protein